MRKLRDVLRLTAAGMSSRQVAASLTVGATTVIDYLGRARRAGIAWPLPDELTDEALEASLYASWSNDRPYRRGGRRLCSLDRRAGSSAVGVVDPGSRRAPPCSRSSARLSGSTSQAATCDLAPRRCEAA